MTGIVGVNRDILGTSLGSAGYKYRRILLWSTGLLGQHTGRTIPPFSCFPRCSRWLGAVENESGIPTVNGAIILMKDISENRLFTADSRTDAANSSSMEENLTTKPQLPEILSTWLVEEWAQMEFMEQPSQFGID